MARLSLAEAAERVQAALRRAGASEAMAASTARALVLAEAQGLTSHGLSRVTQYATHLRNGRVDGMAQAAVLRRKGGALLIDANEGLAFPACDLAVKEALALVREQGILIAAVQRSHHCGVLVDHLRPAALAGMVALGWCQRSDDCLPPLAWPLASW